MMLSKLNDIYELAAELGLDALKQIQYYAYGRPIPSSYRSFKLTKRKGGLREINAPNSPLAYIQRKIMKAIVEATDHLPSHYVYSFKKNCSAKMGVARHVSKAVIIKFDIKDFFGTIHFGRVRGMFKSFPFHNSDQVATTLAQLCCLDKHLPQGAPTSPIISNIVCRKMDRELAKFAKNYGFAYTRYADDMTFSSHSKSRVRAFVEYDEATSTYKASDQIAAIITGNGFTLNHSKTSIRFKHDKQMVTGILCNEKINVDRKYVRRIRTLLHLWSHYDEGTALEAYNKWKVNGSVGNIQAALRGMILYIRHIKGESDPVFLRLASKFNNSCGKRYKITAPFALLGENSVTMQNAVFVIQSHHPTLGKAVVKDEMSEDEEHDCLFYKTGTGFFLRDIGFVTSFHNLKEIAKVFPCNNTNLEFGLEDVIAYNKKLDIAVLSPSSVFSNEWLNYTATPPKVGDNIRYYGFPSYQTGDDIFIGTGTINQKKKFDEQELWSISGQVIKGHSGGPVTNLKGEVLGLIRSNDKHNLFIPISYVASLVNSLGPSIKLKSLTGCFVPFDFD